MPLTPRGAAGDAAAAVAAARGRRRRSTCSGTMPWTTWNPAWSGAGAITNVDLSHDGVAWLPAALAPPPNAFAWQGWQATVTVPTVGFWSIFARATDHTGAVQPMLVPPWNPGGYGNNQVMSLDITVVAPGAVRPPQPPVGKRPCWLPQVELPPPL